MSEGRESLREACTVVVEDAINAVLLGLRERVRGKRCTTVFFRVDVGRKAFAQNRTVGASFFPPRRTVLLSSARNPTSDKTLSTCFLVDARVSAW